MSFVTSIRDYVETLNLISESWGQNFTLTRFISETLLYLLKTLQASLFYIISFQWIRDFTLLPVVLPQYQSSIFKETFFLETPSLVIFDFLEIPYLHQNQFLLGFFNSFFLSLPFSVVSIVALRRLFIQGIPAGVYSISGYLIGQIFFLTCTIFGIRQILIPWLTLEPFNYILGFILIFQIIHSMTKPTEMLMELKGWFLPEYKTFFLTSFLLAWCEQTSIFQNLGNVTLSSTVTILETFSNSSLISFFLSHFLYLLGITGGCLFFTCLWGFLFLQIKKWCLSYTPVFVASFIQFVNKASFVIALALSLTSIPFYGFDYLIAGPLGFVSQDVLFNNTVFDQRNEKMPALDSRLSNMETDYKYLHLDVAPFDRGEYLLTFPSIPGLSFEDLNYRGEFDWINRATYLGITDSKTSIFNLSKVFRKAKKTASPEPLKQSGDSEFEQQNTILTENEINTDLSDLETEKMIAERFVKHYDIPEGTDEWGFFPVYRHLSTTSFPADSIRIEGFFEKNIEQKIKNNYYSNPVYKTLLGIDIDLFLKRQPSSFQLSAPQENDLYTKRRILESYYDSLRNYSQLPYSDIFETFFDGTKTFSNKVYNQQFKGTLRSVRRLFSLTVNHENGDQRILKFDQPLYNLFKKEEFSPYHEELDSQASLSQQLLSTNSEFLETKTPHQGESLFLAKPLYAGWDEQSRKFVITNKLLPKRFAGYQVLVEPELSKKFVKESGNSKRKIKFTTWPLSNQKMNAAKVPFVTLYKNLTPETRATFEIVGAEFNTAPSNIERYKVAQKQQGKTSKNQSQELVESLAPKRGGFLWPGNATFQFFFRDK